MRYCNCKILCAFRDDTFAIQGPAALMDGVSARVMWLTPRQLPCLQDLPNSSK